MQATLFLDLNTEESGEEVARSGKRKKAGKGKEPENGKINNVEASKPAASKGSTKQTPKRNDSTPPKNNKEKKRSSPSDATTSKRRKAANK